MHTPTDSLYWIEAQDFSLSNFARQEGKTADISMIEDAVLASQGRLVTRFQQPGQFLEYAFREDRDGLWPYQVWLRYASPCPGTRLPITLNGHPVDASLLPASGDFHTKFRWEKVAMIEVAKGNHALRMTIETGVIHPDVLVLTPTDEPITSGACERKILDGAATIEVAVSREHTSVDRLWMEIERNGVPLGGLGTGKVELCQDGGLANASINNNQDAPMTTLPGSFFVAREVDASGNATVRLLEKGRSPLPEIKNLTYHGCYPFAEVRYEDTALQTQLTLEAFSPMVPYNVPDSTVPAACFRFKAHNPGLSALTLTLGFSWENLIGCGGVGLKPEYGPGAAIRVEGKNYWVWNDRTGNNQETCQTDQGTGLRFVSSPCAYDSSAGEYVVLCAHDKAVRTAVTTSYNVEADIAALLEDLRWMAASVPETLLQTPGEEGTRHPAGIVWADVTLAPGDTQAVTFVLAWHFPHARDRFGEDGGVQYTQRFPDATSVADYVLRERERLAAHEASTTKSAPLSKRTVPAARSSTSNSSFSRRTFCAAMWL